MPNALIITTAGTNCDGELGRAFELAGASVDFVHLNALIRNPALVDRYTLIGLPGGFSYGDAVAAGRITAVIMRRHIYGALVAMVFIGPLLLWRGFALSCLWEWFAVPLQAPALGVAHATGLFLILRLVRAGGIKNGRRRGGGGACRASVACQWS